jgi:hypothetical protein
MNKPKAEADELPALILKVERLKEEARAKAQEYREKISAYQERIRDIAFNADQTLIKFDAECLAK